MNKQIGIIVAGILLIVLVIAILVLALSQDGNEQVTVTPVPTQTESSPSPAPDEELIEVTGRISEISEAGFQYSTVLTVSDTNIYVTNDTEIEDTQGDEVTVPEIDVGATISAIGTPSEGGIEATQITVLSAAPIPSPTEEVLATPTPSPTE